MSIELSESLGRQSALDLLADIDNACEKIDDNGTRSKGLVKGPFGVFSSTEPVSFSSVHTIHSSSPEDVVDIDAELNNFRACREPESLVEEIERQDWTQQIADANLDLFVSSLDPTLAFNAHDGNSPGQLLIQDASMANFFLHPGSGDDNIPAFSPGFMARTLGNNGPNTEERNTNSNSMSHMELTPTPARNIMQSGFTLPELAEPLLRYYKQHLDGATTAIQAKRKSPWQIIFLPCALETFAELSLWNGASHTRSTILYTLLAHSAFQLHMTNKSTGLPSQWRDIGIRHQEKAQQHLRNALQMEMFGSSQAKYKELLMAILAMAMTSVCEDRNTLVMGY